MKFPLNIFGHNEFFQIRFATNIFYLKKKKKITGLSIFKRKTFLIRESNVNTISLCNPIIEMLCYA